MGQRLRRASSVLCSPPCKLKAVPLQASAPRRGHSVATKVSKAHAMAGAVGAALDAADAVVHVATSVVPFQACQPTWLSSGGKLVSACAAAAGSIAAWVAPMQLLLLRRLFKRPGAG